MWKRHKVFDEEKKEVLKTFFTFSLYLTHRKEKKINIESELPIYLNLEYF